MEPYMHLLKTSYGKILSSTGIDSSLLKTLAQYFQFTFEQVSSKDNEWGINKNGTWTGLVGMVQRKEADFSLCGIAVNEVRTEAIRYSFPFVFSEVIFVVAAPITRTDPLSCIKSITAEVWGMGLIIMACVALILYAKFKSNLLTIFFKLCANLIGKDVDLPAYWPDDVSIKVTLGFWMIFSVLLNAIFGGVLTSNVIPISEPVVETMGALQKAVLTGKLSVGVVEGAVYQQLLTQAKDGLYHDLGTSVRNNPNKVLVPDEIAGLEKVLNEDYAFIETRNVFEPVMEKMGAAKFHTSKECLYTTLCAMIFSKDCWYADMFDCVIKRTLETGLVEKWTTNENFQESTKPTDGATGRKPSIHSLSLNNVQMPFYAFGLGLLLSLVTFFIECVVKCKHDN